MRIARFRGRAAVALVAGASLVVGVLIAGDGTANAAEPDPTVNAKALSQAVLPCDYVKNDPGAWIAKDSDGKTFANDPYNIKTQLAVEKPAAGAEASVDADGQITLSGVLAFKAKFLNASVGRVTAAKADVTVGGLGSTGDYRVWLKTWKAKLRPTRLGPQPLCVQAQETDLIRGHVYRPVTVADHIAPSNVHGLAMSAITDTRAAASWDAATDNFGLAGYDVSINGDAAHRVSSGSRRYNLTGLKPSTSYTVSVVAVDLAGNRSAAPATVNFTTAEPPPPPTAGPVKVEAEEGAAVATWHPGADDARYTVTVNGEPWGTFAAADYCVDATGTPAAPCTPADTISLTLAPLDSDTPYALKVVTEPAGGGATHTEQAQFRTDTVTPPVSEETAEQIVSESRQCAGAGGSVYISPSQRGLVPVPSGSRTIFAGCYEPKDTDCVDKVLPAHEDGKIDCEDDVTELTAKVAPPGQGPQIDTVSGRRALSPTSTCQGGACTVAYLAAGELTTSAPAMISAGTVLATMAWVGGALLLTVALYNTVKSIFFGEPTAILGLLEYNIDYRTDFTTYEEWFDQKGLYYNSLQIYAQIITASRQFATNTTPFAWNDSSDADLRRTIDQACNAQQKLPSTSTSTGCGNGFAIYVPGATSVSKNGLRFMPQTGKHITDTIYPTVGSDHPERVPWFYPARSVNHKALTAAGFSANWYDQPPFIPNECTGRIAQACDEFPFKSTNQAANLSGVRASLRPVPKAEASVQGTDISSFYSKCKVDDEDEFLIIPIPSWVAAGGPSFGFRVGDDNATEMCHGPGL